MSAQRQGVIEARTALQGLAAEVFAEARRTIAEPHSAGGEVREAFLLPRPGKARAGRLHLPLLAGFLRLLLQADLVALYAIHPVGGYVMVLAAHLRIVLGELDTLSSHVVHRADLLAVGDDDFHVLANIACIHHECSPF